MDALGGVDEEGSAGCSAGVGELPTGVGAPKERGAGEGWPKGFLPPGICGAGLGVGTPNARGVMEAEPKGPGLLLLLLGGA